ncbi:MAG: hypothetical protein PVF43_15945 [Candidatus Eiseniibacteriota bacterium]
MREQRDAARRLLAGLEKGGLANADAVVIAEDLDPVLVYAIVSFLRAVYPVTDPAATSVLERVVKLTSASAALVRLHREGGQDPVARWFESEHGYVPFRGRGGEMIDRLVEKLDS